MRKVNDLRSGMLLVLVFAMGCATSSQTLHWREDMTGAATRVSELSAEHTATITLLDGGRFGGRNVSITEDAVGWARTRDGAPQRMPLADVASIEIVTGKHAGEGAWKGAIAGVVGNALRIGIRCAGDAMYCDNRTGTFIFAYGLIGAAGGAIIGALFGATRTDKVIFVP